MDRILSLRAIAPALLAAAACAQTTTIVLPNGTGTAAGNTSHAFPWGWWGTSAPTWPGERMQCLYDATNLTSQGVTSPILITRLRWRPDDGAPACAGGTFQQATVALSTAPIDHSQVSMNFANNHGADRVVAYSGPVTHPASTGSAPGVAAPFTVDIPLTTAFLYDPSLGDLVIDCDYPGGTNYVGGSLPQMDMHNGAQASWMSAFHMYPNASGGQIGSGIVVEVSFVTAASAGVAFATPYGAGCSGTARATFYETFPLGTFDLSNTNWALSYTGTGYAVQPLLVPMFVPLSAPLALGANQLSQVQLLGFSLPYPGGSTTSITISSNGFVWAGGSQTSHGCCSGDPVALRQLGARWCPLWTFLDPGFAGGAVYFDTDPATSAAYVTFSNVVEAGTTNRCTFQIVFFPGGHVDYRYGACAVTNHTLLTGWSPGNGALDPGSVDISTSAIVTSPDLRAPRLAAGSRPIVGANVTLTASLVPAGSPLGAFLGGVMQHMPGLPLASIGMPGCFQYVSLDATRVFVPAGNTGSMVFTVPNAPALSGTHLFWQTAVFANGLNPLGVVSSNGLDLKIGTL